MARRVVNWGWGRQKGGEKGKLDLCWKCFRQDRERGVVVKEGSVLYNLTKKRDLI